MPLYHRSGENPLDPTTLLPNVTPRTPRTPPPPPGRFAGGDKNRQDSTIQELDPQTHMGVNLNEGTSLGGDL